MHYFVTELLRGSKTALKRCTETGGSLDELLQQGPLKEEAAKRVARQVCEGLNCLHSKGAAALLTKAFEGVVHRDLKPGNVLFGADEDGEARSDQEHQCYTDKPNEFVLYSYNFIYIYISPNRNCWGSQFILQRVDGQDDSGT